MTIKATKITHSISQDGIELKTALARYPRFIHAEELTHRILSSSPDMIVEINDGVMYDRNLSRNASSSRAIPVKRLIEDILLDTAMPISWGKNQKGMQAGEEHDAYIDNPFHGFTTDRMGKLYSREQMWLLARDNAIAVARAYDAAGYHKQIVNRLLEPFAHINVLITATDWDNFFELRDHKDAQPEIQALAKAIKAAFEGSVPDLLQPGEWHLPFITANDRVSYEPLPYEARNLAVIGSPYAGMIQVVRPLEQLIKISVARCARTSYLTHEGKVPEVEADLRLYNDLVGGRPLHASPAEHQATPDVRNHLVDGWEQPSLHGNLRGWVQYRKQLELQHYKVAA
ncbi:FAD-dependent thymidylate synthase [Bradyrhizobium ottawaense]|uniref:Thymidylate synthase complementing protein n=1 Tax=Bradyrhizobium ottawaense TaxID=931866 RepID=A0ABY0P640_9BRAD|nr:FAD-dependent thymidylate synthase [Bradyrhizobium ottawaense]SDH38046.1 Thymidylate synthase complementing protein [Bradyrhizobium ottawaense]SDK46349.1 Thymidylate synthase complementing protein [Bradyrhizobium ottawaense]